MKHDMIIEVVAKEPFDEETEHMWNVFTEEQRAERLEVIKSEVKRVFTQEMADDTEINVTVRVSARNL